MLPSIPRTADTSAKWAAIAIGFSVPISVALDNVLLLAVLILWLISANFREKYAIIRKNPVALAALALFGMLAIGMAYGSASLHDALGTLGKYIDLMYVPIFITLFRDEKSRRYALTAFVLSMLLTLLLSYLLWLGILHGNSVVRGFAENPYVFKLHITQSFFMSFAFLILATWCFNETNRWRRILWGALALLALVNVLFMLQGRIGYIVLPVLLIYLFISKLGHKGLLIGIAASSLLGSIAYYGSAEFHKRIDVAASELAHWHPGQATGISDSIGNRLEFYSNTLKIIREHPLFGVGTGGFDQAYAAQVANTTMRATHNPHNEFLLIMVQTGVPGSLLLLLLFSVQWRAASRFQENYPAHGLVLAMISGCLFNSFLLDHAEGLFFAWMTGVLFSGRRSG